MKGHLKVWDFGLKFLRHIDRCKLILHLVDSTGIEGNPLERFKILNEELNKFNDKAGKKLQILCINKVDAGIEENIEELEKYAKENGIKSFRISGATGVGIEELLNYVAEKLRELPDEVIEIEPTSNAYTMDEEDFNIELITKKGERTFMITGKSVERLLGRINVNDNESMYYFHSMLEKLGITKALNDLGVEEGDTINMLDYHFEWYE